jgi:hypothetical protein
MNKLPIAGHLQSTYNVPPRQGVFGM